MVYSLFQGEIVQYKTNLPSGTFDIEPNFDCSDTTATSCCTTKLSDNVSKTREKSPKQFVKPTTSKRKKLKITEGEKEDPQIQKDFDFMQQVMPKEDSTHTFGKYVAEKLNQFDATRKAILIYKINQLIFDAEMEKLSAET